MTDLSGLASTGVGSPSGSGSTSASTSSGAGGSDQGGHGGSGGETAGSGGATDGGGGQGGRECGPDVDTDSDPDNCGACGTTCSAPQGVTALCIAGKCGGRIELVAELETTFVDASSPSKSHASLKLLSVDGSPEVMTLVRPTGLAPFFGLLGAAASWEASLVLTCFGVGDIASVHHILEPWILQVTYDTRPSFDAAPLSNFDPNPVGAVTVDMNPIVLDCVKGGACQSGAER